MPRRSSNAAQSVAKPWLCCGHSYSERGLDVHLRRGGHISGSKPMLLPTTLFGSQRISHRTQSVLRQTPSDRPQLPGRNDSAPNEVTTVTNARTNATYDAAGPSNFGYWGGHEDMSTYDAADVEIGEGDDGVRGASGGAADQPPIHESDIQPSSSDRLYDFESSSDSDIDEGDNIGLLQHITGYTLLQGSAGNASGSEAIQLYPQLNPPPTIAPNLQVEISNQFLTNLRRTYQSKPIIHVRCFEKMNIGSPGKVHRYDTIPYAWSSTNQTNMDVDDVFSPFQSDIDFRFAFWLKTFNISREAADEIIKIAEVR